MTAAIPQREIFERWQARQTPCPVVERFTVEELLAMGPEVAKERLEVREQVIENMGKFPLTHSYEPDIWRRIDMRVAQKRLKFPGRVLTIFVTGGMRPGKSYGCARRMVAHWLWTEKSMVFALSETLATSRKLQQQPVERFLPEEVSPTSGKHKPTKHERFKFSGGHFTNEEFTLRVPVTDETGCSFLGGGDYAFRMFTQDIGTFQGFELTAAWSDELVPLTHVKAVRERMATRAADTVDPAFLYRIEQAEKILASGRRLTKDNTALLGALYHGVHLVSFTPYLGWNETVNYFLAGAVKEEFEISPDLQGKPGVKDPRVPRFAQPKDETALVAYIFTSDNKIKPAYEELSRSLKSAPEKEVRIKLHGDVDRDQSACFYNFESAHLCDWRDIPREGTLYEVIDPGKVKPPAVGWFLVDKLSRIWQVQEWPCESIPIDNMMPGPWAVNSESGRLNGDEGPAYKLKLGWKIGRMVFEIWKMRARILQQFAATGEAFKGKVIKGPLQWSAAFPDGSQELAGDFAEPFMTIIDPRGGKETIEGETLREKYDSAEHGIVSELEPPACTDEDGVRLILDALADRIAGETPRVRINRECTNTQFMFTAYTQHPYSDTTRAKDEACVEWFDLWKYLLKYGADYMENRPRGWRGGGHF